MMRQLLQRIRGAVGMGLLWAAAWSSVGFVLRWVLGMESDLPFPLLFAGLGFLAGLTFSVILSLLERRSRFDELSVGRFALWGAVIGGVFAALFVRGVVLSTTAVSEIAALFALSCASSASGSLLLARRAKGERAELGEGERAARIGEGRE